MTWATRLRAVLDLLEHWMPPKNNKNWPPIAKLTLLSAIDQLVTVSTAGTADGAVGKSRRTATVSPIVSYEVHWGDGTVSADTGAPPPALSHAYAVGVTSVVIQLVVVAANTLRATASLQVTLNSAPPDPDPPPPPPPAPPTCTSLALGDATPTSAQLLTWIATFSEAVQGVTTGAFSLAPVGPIGAAILTVDVLTSTSYRITVDRGSGSGSLGLDLTTPSGITSIATSVAVSGTVVGGVYTISSPVPPPPTPTPPVCTSIVRAAASPTTAATVAWTVTFNEPVVGVTLDAFSLTNVGLTAPVLSTVVPVSTSIYTVTASVGSGTGSLGLNFAVPGGVRDLEGTAATATLAGEFYVIESPAPPPGSGTTYVAASPARNDVAAAIALAVAGDTVQIPAGSATWTASVTVAAGITIRGATISAFGSTAAGTAITNGNGAGFGRLFNITLDPGKITRVTGIYFPESLVNANQGVFQINGSSDQDGSRLVLDHLTMLDFGDPATSAYGIWCQGALGVISRCTFRTDQVGHIPVEVQHENWGGQSFGDGSWVEDSNFGTERFLFIEDCIGVLNNAGFEAFGDTIVDSLNGSRFVVRYCDLTNMEVGNHGTESGGRQRGGRAMEFYNLTFRGTLPGSVAVHTRSGATLAYNLQFRSMFYPSPVCFLEAKRLTTSFSPWGSADGTNAADQNVPGGPFASGTATGGGVGILIDTTKNWTPNQWVGYSLKITSSCTAGVGTETCAAVIIANTATQISILVGGYPPGPLTPVAGQTYQIWKVNVPLDSCGMGTGGLITGDPPVFPAGWNDQVVDPCYAWNWTSPDGTAGQFDWGVYEPSQIRLGTHYFPFGTVKPGYTPYPYPHPLTAIP